MNFQEIFSAEPLRWAEFLRLLVGAEGFLAGVVMLSTVAALADTGLTWLLANSWPIGWGKPGAGQRKLITAAVPFALCLLAALFGSLGGYVERSADMVFGAIQVAGAVAFGGVLTRTGLQAVQGRTGVGVAVGDGNSDGSRIVVPVMPIAPAYAPVATQSDAATRPLSAADLRVL